MSRPHSIRWARPDALPPFEHNRIVARRRKYHRLSKELAAAGRSDLKAAKSFRMLSHAAQRAADSLRDVGRALQPPQAKDHP